MLQWSWKLKLITPHTVVWECCKDDQQSQWGMPNFGVCQHRNPWVDFQKNLQGWLRRDPTPHANIGVNRFKGACLRMREIATLRCLFFLFFNGPCASLQVGPLDRSSPLTAQMTRPRGHHVLFMVSLIKNYFSLFSPKNVKNCITPYGNFEQL